MTDLQKHCEIVHGKKFLCYMCFKAFVDKEGKRFHLVLDHKIHQCDKCDGLFSMDDLVKHEMKGCRGKFNTYVQVQQISESNCENLENENDAKSKPSNVPNQSEKSVQQEKVIEVEPDVDVNMIKISLNNAGNKSLKSVPPSNPRKRPNENTQKDCAATVETAINEAENAKGQENPFCFEKKIKIELNDHVECEKEAQKLNETIEDLKNENSKLEEMQRKRDEIIENLKEDNLKLHREILDLKYGSQSCTQ